MRACALSTLIAKQLYLEAYGMEAVATVTNVSFTTTALRRPHTQWKKIDYEFTTLEGTQIKGMLNWPTSEIPGLPGGKRLTVVCWERFPSINLPRGARAEVLGIATVALVFLLCVVQFGCLSRRFIIRRRGLIATSSASIASERLSNLTKL